MELSLSFLSGGVGVVSLGITRSCAGLKATGTSTNGNIKLTRACRRRVEEDGGASEQGP